MLMVKGILCKAGTHRHANQYRLFVQLEPACRSKCCIAIRWSLSNRDNLLSCDGPADVCPVLLFIFYEACSESGCTDPLDLRKKPSAAQI